MLTVTSVYWFMSRYIVWIIDTQKNKSEQEFDDESFLNRSAVVQGQKMVDCNLKIVFNIHGWVEYVDHLSIGLCQEIQFEELTNRE